MQLGDLLGKAETAHEDDRHVDDVEDHDERADMNRHQRRRVVVEAVTELPGEPL